ncbi:MAG: AtpZ/AtpI family protein [Myxococcota bacterium]|nr:AtpZ/AtpI family protein [Myxococcota bacterium]
MSDPGEHGQGSPLKERYSAKPMGAAYQGSMEAVLSIVIAVLLGWWADRYFDSGPWGVLIGATIGFAAFVLRLSRLGTAMGAPPEEETPPDAQGGNNGDR